MNGATSAPSTPPTNSTLPSHQPNALDKANAALTTNEFAQKAGGFLSPSYQEPFFGCFSDPLGCALSCCCPCVVLATLRANLDGRRVTLVDYVCCPNPYQNRQSLRAKFAVPTAPFNDCAAVVCCPFCAMHQDIREMGRREGKPPQFYMDL